MNWDVIVVGAGPVGSTVASCVAEKGYKVLLLEEHGQVGIPTHCTGKLSVNACRELGIHPKGVLNKLRGAIFYSPYGTKLTIERKETQAYVLDRSIFDFWFAERAIEAGANICVGTRATSTIVKESGVFVRLAVSGNNRKSMCRVVVAADGSHSGVARERGLYTKSTQVIRYTAQQEVIGVDNILPDHAEVFIGGRFAPGFFGWLVPTNGTDARIGLGVKPRTGKTPFDYLNILIREHPSLSGRLRNAVFQMGKGHIIPTGGPLSRTIGRGVLVVGDAAGQVKSTTGGGLYYGILCAKIAGETLCRALEETSNNVLDEKSLLPYERQWRKCLGEEIAFSRKARAFLDSLSDEDVEYIFRLIREDDELQRLILEISDIDYQSNITTQLMSRMISSIAGRPKLLYKAMLHLLLG